MLLFGGNGCDQCGVCVTEQSRISRADGWLTAWVGSELVMMSAESGNYISLTETGGRIWELMEQPRTVGGICEELVAEYDIAHDVALVEVVGFLEEMKSQDAIHVDTPALG